jgi:signal transduction histidine kinase
MAGSVLAMGAQLSFSEIRRNNAQNRLNLVVESVTAGLWEYRLDTDCLSLSEEFCKRFWRTGHPAGAPAFMSMSTGRMFRHWTWPWRRCDPAARRLSIGATVIAARRLLYLVSVSRALDRCPRPKGEPGCRYLCRYRHAQTGRRGFTPAHPEAQGVSKAKSRFISSMSHELRTPLNSIHGFAQLLRLQTTDDQEDAKSLDEILAASQHLAHLVDDLLDWSSLQAETPRLQMRVLEVNGLMRECAEMVRSQAEAAGLDLQLQITSPALSVLADARRLRQILLNLLSNAIKYNRPHGGCSWARYWGRGRVELFVEDGGAGISAELQGALFEPFQRLGQENTAIQGTGIGLALCRELATLMNGSMGLVSESGVGSRFWVDLPEGTTAPAVRKRLLSLCFVGNDEATCAASNTAWRAWCN